MSSQQLTYSLPLQHISGISQYGCLLPTFGEICLQVLDQMVAKKNFIFSTDSYHPDSIKSQERLRRGFSEKFIIDGPATRKPTDYKLFLSNDENKTHCFNSSYEYGGVTLQLRDLRNVEQQY